MIVPKFFIQMIVGRVHVGASNREMLRYLRSRFKDARTLDHSFKKRCYRHAIKVHQQNRDLYCRVRSGRI